MRLVAEAGIAQRQSARIPPQSLGRGRPFRAQFDTSPFGFGKRCRHQGDDAVAAHQGEKHRPIDRRWGCKPRRHGLGRRGPAEKDEEKGHFRGLRRLPVTITGLCARLCEEFEVDAQTCEAEVLKFVNELVDNGIAHAAAA